MKDRTLTLLNSSVLTEFGTYRYERLSLIEARQFVQQHNGEGGSVQSAIGHQATADLLSLLLDFPLPNPRTEFCQSVGEIAMVFKLKQRLPEGKVFNREEMERIGYQFGLLTRLA